MRGNGMKEANHTQLLRMIANHPHAREEITGNPGKVKTLRKAVSRGVYMIYVLRSSSARVEIWMYRGSRPHQVDEAKEIHAHFRRKKEAIEKAFGSPLNWNHGRRKTAYSIQHDYDDFDLNNPSTFPEWADRMVTDMNRLHDALKPHFL